MYFTYSECQPEGRGSNGDLLNFTYYGGYVKKNSFPQNMSQCILSFAESVFLRNFGFRYLKIGKLNNEHRVSEEWLIQKVLNLQLNLTFEYFI